MASERDPANLGRFAAALSDESEPVRWWAVQGLGMLGHRAAAQQEAVEGLLQDASGAVQVAAAEALVAMGFAAPALPVLERWLTQTENFYFKLQAANVTARIGEQARPLAPVLRRIKEAAPKGGAKQTGHSGYQLDLVEKSLAILEGKAEALVYPARR
jgi:HEAT repeat protein